MRRQILFVILLSSLFSYAQRSFFHPGTICNQADLDRMKAMVAAKREPYYTAWNQYVSSSMTTYRDYLPTMRGSAWNPYAIFDNTNLYMGTYGDIALHNALCWKITGTETYAKKAKDILNCYLNLHGTVNYGTACLSNSGFSNLIDAAELMRDYSGWAESDQKKFKDMLVYPGYSTRERMNETRDSITIYWNIYQGDDGRHGNQGLWGLRCMIGLGIYCDNDTIYDRALNRFLSRPHRSDDLPYPAGPKTPGSTSTHAMSSYYTLYNPNQITRGSTIDYGYDDELKYWIWENGQSQEASRDQGHIMDGLGNLVDIARLFRNQGDDVYQAYDHRILKGIDYASKYNYGWYNANVAGNLYWKEEELFEPTLQNGQFIQRLTRNARWFGLKINPWSENNDTVWTRGKRLTAINMMFPQFKVRQGLGGDSLRWLQRAYNIKQDVDGLTEDMLLNYRAVWMAGDGGHFSNGQFVPGLPAIPCTVKSVDYDYYSQSLSGDGLTYHNIGTRKDSYHRKEGGLDIVTDNGGYVLTALKDGEWMNYTLSNAVKGWYQVSVTAKVVGQGSSLGIAVDNGTEVVRSVPSTIGYETLVLGKLKLQAGAVVLRMYVHGTDDQIQLSDLRIEATTADVSVPDYVWNSRDYVPMSGSGSFLSDQSDKLLTTTSFTNATTATFALNAESFAYRVKTEDLYLVMHGRNLEHALFKSATFRLPDGTTDVIRSSTGGQTPTWMHSAMGNGKDETFLIWKVDSSSSSRIVPLLKSCYTGGYASYILKNLSFLAYGSNVHWNTDVDDIGFYNPSSLLAAYPELNGMPVGLKTLTPALSKETNHAIYSLDGRLIHELKPDEKVEEILQKLPKSYYLVGSRIVGNF
jgi:hypothetical protein